MTKIDNVDYFWGYADAQRAEYITKSKNKRYKLTSPNPQHLSLTTKKKLTEKLPAHTKRNTPRIIQPTYSAILTELQVPQRPQQFSVHYLRGWYDAIGRYNHDNGKLVFCHTNLDQFLKVFRQHINYPLPSVSHPNKNGQTQRLVFPAKFVQMFLQLINGYPRLPTQWAIYEDKPVAISDLQD